MILQYTMLLGPKSEAPVVREPEQAGLFRFRKHIYDIFKVYIYIYIYI